jgi:hypothetical protein
MNAQREKLALYQRRCPCFVPDLRMAWNTMFNIKRTSSRILHFDVRRLLLDQTDIEQNSAPLIKLVMRTPDVPNLANIASTQELGWRMDPFFSFCICFVGSHYQKTAGPIFPTYIHPLAGSLQIKCLQRIEFLPTVLWG